VLDLLGGGLFVSMTVLVLRMHVKLT
jgi:hypothetical protein